MRELWHNQLSCLNHEELIIYFNISKGTLLEQKVIHKQTIEARIFLKLFFKFVAVS